MANAAETKRPCTFYFKNGFGGIGKAEGFLTSVASNGTGGGVNYIPKRGRREQMIMTYYSSFIMVVEGWGKPDPDSGMEPTPSSGSTPGVETSRSRYRSTDPRWVSDFMEGPGKSLHPIVLFQDGRLVKDTSGLPREASLQEKVLRFASELPAGSAERKTLLHILATSRT